MGADVSCIIDIRVTENHGEVAKYVTKPGRYLELTGGQWQCDDRVLETLQVFVVGGSAAARAGEREVSCAGFGVSVWSFNPKPEWS